MIETYEKSNSSCFLQKPHDVNNSIRKNQDIFQKLFRWKSTYVIKIFMFNHFWLNATGWRKTKVERRNLQNVLLILPVGISWLNKDKYFIEACLDGFGKPFCHPNIQRVSKWICLTLPHQLKLMCIWQWMLFGYLFFVYEQV